MLLATLFFSLQFCTACCLLFRIQSLFGFFVKLHREPFYIPWDKRNFTNYSINLQFSVFQSNFCYFPAYLCVIIEIPQIQPSHAIHTGKQGWVGGWPHNIVNIVWIIFKWVQRLVILKGKSWFLAQPKYGTHSTGMITFYDL